MKSRLGVICGGLLVLLLSLLLLLVALPFTAFGTRWILQALPRMVPVQITYQSGRLAGDLYLDSIVFNSPALSLTVENIHSRLRPACWWQSEVCFSRLDVGKVDLHILPDAGSGQSAGDAEALAFPLVIRAASATLQQLQVRWPGGSWQQKDTQLDLLLQPEGLQLSAVKVASAGLRLDSADTNGSSSMVALPEIVLPVPVDLDGLRIGQSRWQLDETVYLLRDIALSARWQGAQLTVNNLQLRYPEAFELSADASLRFQENWPLDANLAIDLLQPTGWDDLTGQRGQFSLTGDLSKLAVHLAVPALPGFELRATVNTLVPDFPFQLEAEMLGSEPLQLASIPGWPLADNEMALTEKQQLMLVGNRYEQRIKATLGLLGTGYSQLDIAVSATHRDKQLVFTALQLEDKGTGSALALTGKVSYKDDWRWQGELRSTGLTLPEQATPVTGRLAGRVEIAGFYNDRDWALQLAGLDWAGQLNQQPITVQGDISLNRRDWLAAGQLNLQSKGTTLLIKPAADRAVVISVEQLLLGDWLPEARGELSVEALWQPQQQTLGLSASLANAGWQAWTATGASLQLSLPVAAGTSWSGRLLLTNPGYDGQILEQLSFDLSGSREAPELQLASRGAIEGSIGIGGRQRENGQWAATLSSPDIATPLGQLTLDAPGPVAISGQGPRLEISPHCWRLSAAALCFRSLQLGPDGNAEISLDGDLAVFSPLLPFQLELAGRLDGNLRAEWQPQRVLQFQAGLVAESGQLTELLPEGETADFAWEQISLQAVLVDDLGLQLSLAMQQNQRTVVSADVQLPPRREQRLTGNLQVDDWQAGLLRPFIPSLSRLGGSVSGQLQLTGTAEMPVFSGRLSWRDGVMTLSRNPTTIEAIELDVTLDETRLLLAGAGRVGEGPLTINGSAAWQPELALNLQLQGSNNRLLYPPETQFVVSPTLQLVATPEQLSISGDLVVDSGLLSYEQLPAGSVDLSSDVVEVDYQGEILDQQQPFDLSAAIRVRINDRLLVRGRDLDVTVGGELDLRQSPQQPLQVFGNLNIIGGEYRAYGQLLAIKQGQVSFSGSAENPQLNLRAEREIRSADVLVGISAIGTLEQPQVELYSQPSMEQAEMLSYLLRGRGLDVGAGADGAAMALSLGTTALNQSGVVRQLNRVPGLRNIEFGTQDLGDDTAATIGGYFGDRIYLAYGVGVYDPVNVVTARLYLQTRLWLEIVSRLESSIDLYYSFDID